MSEEQDEGRQPGVYYPDDVEKGINMDKTLGIRHPMVSIVEELVLTIASIGVVIALIWLFLPGTFWDIVDLISLGL